MPKITKMASFPPKDTTKKPGGGKLNVASMYPGPPVKTHDYKGLSPKK